MKQSDRTSSLNAWDQEPGDSSVPRWFWCRVGIDCVMTKIPPHLFRTICAVASAFQCRSLGTCCGVCVQFVWRPPCIMHQNRGYWDGGVSHSRVLRVCARVTNALVRDLDLPLPVAARQSQIGIGRGCIAVIRRTQEPPTGWSHKEGRSWWGEDVGLSSRQRLLPHPRLQFGRSRQTTGTRGWRLVSQITFGIIDGDAPSDSQLVTDIECRFSHDSTSCFF